MHYCSQYLDFFFGPIEEKLIKNFHLSRKPVQHVKKLLIGGQKGGVVASNNNFE